MNGFTGFLKGADLTNPYFLNIILYHGYNCKCMLRMTQVAKPGHYMTWHTTFLSLSAHEPAAKTSLGNVSNSLLLVR